MMFNGKVLALMSDTTVDYGTNSVLYEYDYTTDTFTLVPNTPVSVGVSFSKCFLNLPDGTILCGNGSGQLYSYQPDGLPLAAGKPVITGATLNTDGSYHVTGTLFNGISAGSSYGDDHQMDTDYPIAHITNSIGNFQYARTFNWSTCNLMTGTNIVSTDIMLPAGLLAGTYPLIISANGISSAPFALAIAGTPLPPVTGLGITSVSSTQIAFQWGSVGLTETGFVIQRSTDGTNFTVLATVAANVTTYADSTISPLSPYYYRVIATNSVGIGNAGPAILAASKPTVALAAPFTSQDVGAPLGLGASGQAAGVYTVTGAGSGVGSTNDQFQYAAQPIAGDVTITTRLTAESNGGTNAFAGLMLRTGLDGGSADAFIAFNGAASLVFGSRAADGSISTNASIPSSFINPIWLRLVRSGNTVTALRSDNGTVFTTVGSVTVAMEPVIYAGLAVSSGNAGLLNAATFDNLTVTGTAPLITPPTALWKLDETTGTTAVDSRGGYNGVYNGVVLGQPGATADTGFSAGFNGSANVTVPPLGLNTNVITITAWVNPNGLQAGLAGVFQTGSYPTGSGLVFGDNNQIGSLWNGAQNGNSGLFVPTNQWTFVAVVITPTQTMYYTVTNGVISGVTNSAINPAVNFAVPASIGNSDFGGFNGLLDEVAIYGNQALTPAQIKQIASTPIITISSPTAGAGFAAPATINVTATLTATSGHTINLVQFFANGILAGQATSSPYTTTLTGYPAGTYALSSRVYYDSGLVASSGSITVLVQNTTVTPLNVVATALASNLVNVSWSAAANATGYIVKRNGTAIATVTSPSFSDFGLLANANYCYSVLATNLVSTSAESASSCVNTLATGGALVWDAGSLPSGPQDGSDNWSSTAATWWNGSANVNWADGNVATFGLNMATNSIVTITKNVAPAGVVFNATRGTYTVGGANTLAIASNMSITANGNAIIMSPLSGANFTKNGVGSLVLSNQSPAFTGIVAINAGALEMQLGPPPEQIGYVIGTNGILRHGYNTGPDYNQPLVIIGGGPGSTNGLYIAAGTALSENYLTISNGPTTIYGYGSGATALLQFFDGQDTDLRVTAAASGSVISTNVNINLQAGYGAGINTELGANTASGDLVINGSVVASGNTLNKYGAGSLRLAGANSYGSGTTVNAGTIQLANNQTPLGAGQVEFAGSGTLQVVVPASLDNAFMLDAGNTMTVDTLTNALTITGAINNSGAVTKIGTGKLVLAGNSSYTGATTVSAGTLQVDGPASATAVTVANTATLGGTGILAIAPVLSAGSTLAPGDSGIGTLTISAPVTLAATTVMELSKAGSALTNDAVTVTGTLTYGGALVVTNIGAGILSSGDSFKLFNAGAYTGSFASTTLPVLIGGLSWSTANLAVNGTIAVTGASGVNTTPTNIVAVVSGANLQITWPANQTGWRLLTQTNKLAGGISVNTNDWMTVAGSASTNSATIPIDRTKVGGYYRLVYP